MCKQVSRENITEYLKKQYNTMPENLWIKYPKYTVFRRNDNNKWFCIIMDIPKSKLGLNGNEIIDVLDIKCGPILNGSLIKNQGFYPGYHMNKLNWITILLDGSVSFDNICELINISYNLTKTKKLNNKNQLI